MHFCVSVIADICVPVEYIQKGRLQYTMVDNGLNSESFQEQEYKVLHLVQKIYL